MEKQYLFDSELKELDIITINGIDYMIYVFDVPQFEPEYYAFNLDQINNYTRVNNYDFFDYNLNWLLYDMKTAA